MKESKLGINVSVRLLPFGYASIEVKEFGKEEEPRKKISPVYLEPKTTNPQLIEITFDGETYTVPKTTGGLF